MPDATPRGFGTTWQVASEIPGWLTEDQARLLWDTAASLPPNALLLEIGSHQGRSTVVLAAAGKAVGGHVVAVDPFVEGRLFGGGTTRAKFEQHLSAAGLDRRRRPRD